MLLKEDNPGLSLGEKGVIYLFKTLCGRTAARGAPQDVLERVLKRGMAPGSVRRTKRNLLSSKRPQTHPLLREHGPDDADAEAFDGQFLPAQVYLDG